MKKNSTQQKHKVQEPPPPGTIKAVTINGRTHLLVIGREYAFRLKPGAVATTHPDSCNCIYCTPSHPLSNSEVKKAAKAEEKAVKAAPKKAAKKVATKGAKPV